MDNAAPERSPLYLPLVGIFILFFVQSLVWASDFLIPVIAAFLGYLVLNRPRRTLEKFGLPPAASAFLFTAILTALITLLLVRLSSPTAAFIEDLPSLIEQIRDKLESAGGTLEAVKEATDAAQEIVADSEGDTLEVEVVQNTGIAASIFSMAPGFLSRIMFGLILLFFLVASGDMFLTKMVQSISSFSDKRRTVAFVYSVEDRLGYYLGGITLINAGLGIAVGLAAYLWDLPSPVVLGFMAFALNFVPFLGGLMGAIIAAAVAFVSLDGVWSAFGVFATYIFLTSVEGQLITPYLISRRMRLNPPIVFLTVAFFAWIWSVMGMIVALPILIVIKLICDETESLRSIGRFLGDAEDKQGNGEPKTA